jgi:hypothetical protein
MTNVVDFGAELKFIFLKFGAISLLRVKLL